MPKSLTSVHFFNIIFFISTYSLLFLTNTTDATELATEVCKNTTNIEFCSQVLFSDPRAPKADRIVLAYIAFRRAYFNATDTTKYLAGTLESGGRKSKIVLSGLKKCKEYYEKATWVLSEVLMNLDSDTFYEFDKRAMDVDRFVRKCEASFNGHSPISWKNDEMIKLSNVCLVVAKLFPYH